MSLIQLKLLNHGIFDGEIEFLLTTNKIKVFTYKLILYLILIISHTFPFFLIILFTQLQRIPYQFMDELTYLRKNTDVSDLPSSMSTSVNLQQNQQSNQKKITQLINKTLKYLNHSKDLMQFTKKIVIPKVKRNLFVEELQRKKMEINAQKLLSGGVKAFSKQQDNKSYQEHNIYDNPLPQTNHRQKNYQQKRKVRNRHNHTLLLQHKQTRKSLSKIQVLKNRQRQQTIDDDKYNHQDYIFLDVKKLGESCQISEDEQQNQISSQLLQQKKIYDEKFKLFHTNTLSNNNKKDSNSNNKHLAISLNIEGVVNRPKVKSVDKYYRDRINGKQDASDSFIKVESQSYRKTLINHDNQKSDRSLLKLFPVKKTPKSDINGALGTAFRSMIGLSRLPSKIMQKKTLKTSEDRFAQQLTQINRFYQQKPKQYQDCLYNLLSNISKEKNKDAIRIFKQEFAKIYAYRYGRDKITQFLTYQHIETYDSLLQLFTETILSLNKNEVILLSFIHLDYDNDGLISHSDLFKLLTLMDDNELAKKTIFRVIKHVLDHVRRENVGIKDTCTDQYTKKENLTLKKYRFMMYMKERKNASVNSKSGSSSISKIQLRQQTTLNLQNNHKYNTHRSHRREEIMQRSSHHLSVSSVQKQHFVLQKEKSQDHNKNDHILREVFQAILSQNSELMEHNSELSFFWINIERFKAIYQSIVPQIYYDILYAAFGFKIKGIQYNRLDYETPLLKEGNGNMLSVMLQNSKDKWELLSGNLQSMRYVKEELKSNQLGTDMRRSRRIKTILQ